MELLPEETPITFITGDGATGELRSARSLCSSWTAKAPMTTWTAAYIPAVALEKRTRFDMDDLIAVMTRLRAPGRLPLG